MALSRRQAKRKFGVTFLSAGKIGLINLLGAPGLLHVILGVTLVCTCNFLILAKWQMVLLLDLDEEALPVKGGELVSESFRPLSDEVFGGCNDDWSDVLWSGGTRIDTTKSDLFVQKIEICVAYCHEDLKWIREAVANEFPQQVEINLTIMSKCNNEADIVDFGVVRNVKVEVIKLPNKGGCDLAYAYFISRYLGRESSLQASASALSTVLLFLKGTAPSRHDGRLRSLNGLVRLALQRDDFICGLELDCWMSAYHDARTLRRYMLYQYTRIGGGPNVGGVQFNTAGYRNLSDFLDRGLNWTFPNDGAIQVCYGGRFATTESRLINGNSTAAMQIIFRRLEQALMEGSAVMSVVEHFVERLWAEILAKPLTSSQVKEILALHEFVLEEQGGHMGTFASENISGCCQKINWEHMHWGSLNSKAEKAAQLLGFNEEIWDGDDDNVPIYSTPFGELTEDKREAVVYLGLRSYFKDDVPLGKNWKDLSLKARAEAKVLGFTEDLWDSNHAEMDSHLFPLYSTALNDLSARERKAVAYLDLEEDYQMHSYRPKHLRNRPRYVARAHLADAQIKKLSEMKILLFLTTHLSKGHERALREIWTGLVKSSDLLSNADVLVHHSNTLPDLTDLLKGIFPARNVTAVQAKNEGYQEGAIRALADAIEQQWFETYDWVVRVNPDVIIRNDTWIVSQMLDPDVRGILVDCHDGLLNRSGNRRNKAHTDFFAVRPEYMVNRSEALKRGLDKITNAANHFTAAVEDAWSTGHAAILPDNDLNRGFCRVRGDSSSVVHNHEYLARLFACIEEIGDRRDNHCMAMNAVELLGWECLSLKARTAARLLGFERNSWDNYVDSNDENDEWIDKMPSPVFFTPWNELAEDKREAILYLGLESVFEH